MKNIRSVNGSGNFEIAHSNQELIAEKNIGRRKSIIMIASGTLVLIVIALVIAAIVLLSDSIDAASITKEEKTIALEDILNGSLSPKGFNGTWISGHEILYRSQFGDVMIYDTNTLTSKVLLPFTVPILATTIEYTVSADRKFLLVSHDLRKLFRYSYVTQYTIINLETRGTTSLNANGEVVLQLAIWGPVGNSLVFVARNNIFYMESVLSTNVKQITTDGIIGKVYNGVPDWVYEEEVFASNKAIWLSPDGKKLAYAKFTDTYVPIMTLPVYGEPGTLEFQYTRAVQVRYPKPGTPNPFVSLHVADLESESGILNLEAPSTLENREPVLAAVSWATASIISAIWMNRVQNEASVVAYNTDDPFTTEIIKNLKQNGGWLELFKSPVFSKDGTKLLLILSQDQGNNLGSYKHITILDRKQNSPVTAVTRGQYVVTDILGWDEAADLIYFQATGMKDSASQHIYTVSLKSNVTSCLTCNLKSLNTKSDCSYNSAEFSKNFSQYVLNCDGPGVPENVVVSRHKRIAVWENNKEISDVMKTTRFPTIEKFTFDVADGFKANVLLKLPHNLDRSGNTKYPMLVNVYGGPDSYQVVDKYGLDWGSYLAANKSIIYATIDGRGSGLRGDDILFSLYRRLGTIEITDQINVTRQMQEQLPFIDPSRTAIWGWSYGGFASGMVLATDTEGIFKCGISVAPVTDWALYDSIYTERFMGLPTSEDNQIGYKNAQLVTKFNGLRDKLYFLIHGTLDDNVHYQQSMLWAKVLEQQDILFRQLTYPDEDHSLGTVRPHLYHSLENFLDECFIAGEDD